ncbi:MAG: Gfo/Idh/MocA family oxidoreductase [Bryobacterales bacterium]|nr:Gfo/Idh/MocA family oxidoreductase [Bryobacterales bacterium]
MLTVTINNTNGGAAVRTNRRGFLVGAAVAGGLAAGTAKARAQADEGKLRLAVAGLVHGHARGFLNALVKRADVEVVGISEQQSDVLASYGERFSIPAVRRFRDAATMVAQAKPQAVAAFGSTFDHPEVVELCAMHKLPVMMEKPLAVSLEHARRIRRAAESSGIAVMVNYETTWYRSHAAQWNLIKQQTACGQIRKMVAMDGHAGPKEIGVGPEFFAWLTDPVRNGAGALFDFGCYGANLMTWLMDNQRPLGVTARTLTAKPHIYSKVDDEATILLDYPRAQGIVQASWNWPYNRKDFEVYGASGYAHAIGGNTLRVRLTGERQESTPKLAELPEAQRDAVSHLAAIVRGQVKPNGLSSLENNLIATEILVAARESAATGRMVVLG